MSKVQDGKTLCSTCKRSVAELRRALQGKRKEGDTITYREACKAVGACPECRTRLHATYRRATGICETCGHVDMTTHARCQGCSLLVGLGHEVTRLEKVGDYKICGYCLQQWQGQDIALIFQLGFKFFMSSQSRPVRVLSDYHKAWMKNKGESNSNK